MAKKKRQIQKQTAAKAAPTTPVEPVQSTPAVAPTEAINTDAAPAGQLVVQRRMSLAPYERIALALGLVLLLVAAVWAFQSWRHAGPAATGTKQPVIPMTIDDFKDDPSVQRAIEKQLDGQSKTSTSAPTARPCPRPTTCSANAASWSCPT